MKKKIERSANEMAHIRSARKRIADFEAKATEIEEEARLSGSIQKRREAAQRIEDMRRELFASINAGGRKMDGPLVGTGTGKALPPIVTDLDAQVMDEAKALREQAKNSPPPPVVTDEGTKPVRLPPNWKKLPVDVRYQIASDLYGEKVKHHSRADKIIRDAVKDGKAIEA